MEIIGKQTSDLFVRVEHEVSLNCEMTAIVKKLAARGREPVVFFERMEGSGHSAVANLFANRKAIALALDCDTGQLNRTYLEKLKNPIAPRMVETGPVKDVVQRGDEVDLNRPADSQAS